MASLAIRGLRSLLLIAALTSVSPLAYAAGTSDTAPTPWVQDTALAVESKVIELRRHIHRHPELGNFEHKTAELVADHLKALGLEVHTGIAGTGVVAVLQGGLDGPTVGLRADMDALPVKETSGLPFASQAKGIYAGKEVDVMHACGHDAHTAMLLGAATVLAENKDKVPGKVVFIFQPAEEGAADVNVFDPDAPSWGARRMVEEGVIETFGIESVFGVHVMSNAHTGQIQYKMGAALNSADGFRIRLEGRQAHGAMPWTGADPIVASANVINGIQTLVSRQSNLSQGNAVETFVNQAASEDFSYFSQKVPGLYIFLGATPLDQDLATAPSNHDPGFFVDEATLITGVRSHVEFVLGYADYAAGKGDKAAE